MDDLTTQVINHELTRYQKVVLKLWNEGHESILWAVPPHYPKRKDLFRAWLAGFNSRWHCDYMTSGRFA